jgi:membrane protease YdiL (CAAX protease family)
MWEKINKFVNSHVILSTLLLVVLFMSALLILTFSVIDVPQDGLPPGTYELSVFTIIQLSLSVVIIFLMRKMEVFDIDEFKPQNMGKGFLLSWIGIVLVIHNFLLILLLLPPNSLIVSSVANLTVVILHPFIGTGFFEEVLFRGLVLKILLRKMGHTKKGIVVACVISSAMFGGVHILNFSAGVAAILPTIFQIIYAAAIGFLYAVIYLRTKNLLIPIILHGLINLASQIFTHNAIVSHEAMQQVNFAHFYGLSHIEYGILSTSIIVLSFTIVSVVLLRKVKPIEVADS